MRVFSIGFENRTFNELVESLEKVRINKIFDVRCFPEADSAGYAKGSNFKTSLTHIAYEHLDLLAPTPELLKRYFEQGLPWKDYEESYISLLDDRKVQEKVDPVIFEGTCLMCLEHDPAKCHRRLALEYLNKYWRNLEITHL